MSYPTAADTSIKAGDYVRSFDFPGNTDHFVEGVVEAVTSDRQYRIAVARVVREGAQRNDIDINYVWAPVNGMSGLFGPTRGVVKADEPAI